MTATEHAGRRAADPILIAALASGATLQEAADQGSVSMSTVRRRLEDPAFRRAVDDMRGDMIDAAVGRLSNLAREMTEILADLARHARSEHVRHLSAAKVIELGKQLRETQVLEQRIAELETRFTASQSKNAASQDASPSGASIRMFGAA